MNFINGEAFFIFPDVQIEFPHAYVLSMKIVFFFTGSYYKHLTVSNEVISHKQTIEQTNHPQCQLVLIRFDRNNNFISYFRMYLVLYSQHLRLIAYFNVWLEVIVTLIYGPKTTTENKAGNLFLSPLVVATFKLL